MDDGVLVEVTRGGWVESRHRRVVAVVDAEGGVALQVCQSASNVGFSRTCRAVVAGSRGMENACAEELEAGAAIHGSLDGLDAVDLPLGGACGPGQVKRRLHGGEVPAQADPEVGEQGAGCVVEHTDQALLALVAQQQVQSLCCESAVGFGADQRDKILKGPVTPGSRARADSHASTRCRAMRR